MNKHACLRLANSFFLAGCLLWQAAPKVLSQAASRPGTSLATSTSAASNAVNIARGSQIIDARALNGASGFAVAHGATAIIDFSKQPSLNITGNIRNSGTIYAVSSNPSVSTASFNASNITNLSRAVLTSALPSGGISGLANLVQKLSLNLSALNNIVNAGRISSAANLTMSASNSIINTGTISAAQNINVRTGIEGLSNSGTISSLSGHINISNLAGHNLIVNNLNGTLEALHGSVNLSTVKDSILEKLNISLLRGDILSKELNIQAPNGAVSIDAGTISGVVNISAGEAHVIASSPELKLGTLTITGDPTFYNPAPNGDIEITGSITTSGNNLAIIASRNIYTTANNISIDTSNSTFNGGNILMVAGAAMTPSGSGTGDNTTTTPGTVTAVTISGASSTGGYIDLTGAGSNNITGINSSGGSVGNSNWNGGTVTLVAYEGSESSSGTITLPASSTISTSTASTTGGPISGSVLIIAGASSGNAISIGAINTSGDSSSGVINNGLISIFNAQPVLLTAANYSTNPSPTSVTTLLGNFYPAQTFIQVTDPTGISPNQTLIINSVGGNSETVIVSPTYSSGTTIPLTNPLQQYHGPSESVMVSASSITTSTNELSAVIQNGGGFGPGTFQNGIITLSGSINSGANVVIGTSTSGSGQVVVNNTISLSQNPTASGSYNNTPLLQISGAQVNVNSNISSAISGCSVCQDTLNIYTGNLANSATISGTAVNIQNLSSSTLTVGGNGTLQGVNSNPIVNIQSAGSLILNAGSGNTGTITVPSYAVIALSTANNNTIQVNSSFNFNAGNGGLVTISSQGANGGLTLGSGCTLQISGGPIVSVSTPNLLLNNGSAINASGASPMIFSSGALVQSPQDLNVSVAGGGSASISTSGGSGIILRPADGQDINFNVSGTGAATLAFTGATVYLFTGTKRGTSAQGTVQIGSSITVTAPKNYTSVDPNGGITGIAFEPYVGPATSFPSAFTLGSAYTYAHVLLLMAPIAATGLFQSLGTYNQGSALINGQPSNLMTSYVINGATRLVIQAASQMGLQVTAGASVEDPSHVLISAGTNVEINWALQQAATYGNVMDMVIGNECIIADGSGNIASSISPLVQSINYAQTQRSSYGFNASTLPVTTRQTYGSLSGVNKSQFDLMTQTTNLLNGCSNCYGLTTYTGVDNHVYADVYPYYDQPIISYLAANPQISQSDFQTLVTNNQNTLGGITSGIQPDLNGTISAFAVQNIVPQLWVAETGWATTSTGPPANNAPQANLTWASWYYPNMQSWSANSKATSSTSYQIPITGYFESYDEPVKYTSNAGQGGEPNFGIWTATGTTSTVPNQQFVLTSITPKYTLSPVSTTPGPLTTASSSATTAVVLASSNMIITSSPMISKLDLSGIDSQLASLGAATNSPNRTIIPTDINPEIKSQDQNSSMQNTGAADGRNQASSGNSNPLTGNLIFNQADVELNPSASFLTFSGTNVLLAPDHNVTVRTNLAQIQIEAGAAVMLIQTGRELAIYALHDEHSGAVQVTVEGQVIEVPVGRQLLLTSNQDSAFDKINPSAIGYRNLSNKKFGLLNVYMSEVSLPTALSTTKSIHRLMGSSKRDEQVLARKLLKTAAAMIMLGKDKSPFKASH